MGISALITGCGSNSDLPLGNGPSATAPAAPVGALPAAQGVSVTGRVDTTQVGGSNLNVLSIFQPQGQVTAGNFQTSVSDNTPQTLLVLDGSGDLRALALNLPGQSPTFDARSTALALTFMAPGISVMEVALAQSRVSLILAATSFNALVAALAARMPTATLQSIFALPEVQQLIVQVVQQVNDSVQARQILARTLEENEQIRSDGYIVMTRDESDTTNISIKLSNEGWRFVLVVREDHFSGGQAATNPILAGSPITVGKPPGNTRSNYIQGTNAFTPISLLFGAAGAPGSAVDVIPQRATQPIDRVVYYIKGPGNFTALGAQEFPAHIEALFKENDALQGGQENGLTAIYYFFFPIMEPLLATVGLSSKVSLEVVSELVSRIMLPLSQGGNGVSVVLSARTGDFGNYNLALGEALYGFFSLCIAGMAAFLSGPVAAAAAAIEVLLVGVGAVFGSGNLAAAAFKFFRTPDRSDVQLLIRRKFLQRLGSVSELTVQDLNGEGTMTVRRPTGTFLEPLGLPAVQLLNVSGQALVNDANWCLFQADDHLSHARLRYPGGQMIDIAPPSDSQSTFAEGIACLSPQAYCVLRARRDDGKNDFYTLTEGGSKQFLGAPQGLAPSTSVNLLPHTTETTLFGNADAGGVGAGSPFVGFRHLGSLVTYPFPSGPWHQRIIEPQVTSVVGAVSFTAASNQHILESESFQSFFGASPPDGVDWGTFLGFLIQTAAPFHVVHTTYLRGPKNRTVFQSTSTGPGGSSGITHTAIGLNDDGDVLGTIREGGVTRPVLWTEAAQLDLISLFPDNAPAGTWRPLKMAGRFIVLEHSDGTGSSIYLFSRGV